MKLYDSPHFGLHAGLQSIYQHGISPRACHQHFASKAITGESDFPFLLERQSGISLPLPYFLTSPSHISSTLALHLVKRPTTRIVLPSHSLSVQFVRALTVPWGPLNFWNSFKAVPTSLCSLYSVTWKYNLLLPSLPLPQ